MIAGFNYALAASFKLEQLTEWRLVSLFPDLLA